MVRIDKWLWAARIYPTRGTATEACKKGRVVIDGVQVKPSRAVKEGEVVLVKKPPFTFSYKILKAIEKRVGAKLLPEIYQNVTSVYQYQLMEMSRLDGYVGRDRGTGRPTKKERRSLEEFTAPDYLDDIFRFD